MRMRLTIFLGFLILTVAACSRTSQPPATTEITTEGLTATSTPLPKNDNSKWDRVVEVNKTQTKGGLELTLVGIGLSSPERILSPEYLETADSSYVDAKTVIAVRLMVRNPTVSAIFLPVYTSSTLLANDEQLHMDMMLSTVETNLLPGASVDMTVAFLSQRYTADAIRTVRFVLEKDFSLDEVNPEGTYDFKVFLPD